MRFKSVFGCIGLAVVSGLISGLIVRWSLPATRIVQIPAGRQALLPVQVQSGLAEQPSTRPIGRGAISLGVWKSDARDKSLTALYQPLPRKVFEQATIEEVNAWLNEQTGLDVRTNYFALELEGVDRNAKIDGVIFEGESLGQAMQDICDLFGHGGFVELTYGIRAGGFEMTTEAEESQRTETRIYEIDDLLLDMRRGSVRLAAWFGWPDNPQAAPPDQDDLADKLVEVLTDSIATDTWMYNGGSIGSIHLFDGMLFIDQMPRHHREIELLLMLLHVVAERQLMNIPLPEGVTEKELLDAKPPVMPGFGGGIGGGGIGGGVSAFGGGS